MKTAVSTYSLWGWCGQHRKSIEAAVDLVGTFGVDGIEFVARSSDEGANPIAWAKKMRRRCDAMGLKVAGYCTGTDLMVPPAEQAKAIGELKARVDIAAELGATRMRHDVTHGPKAGETLSQILKTVVPAIQEVADYAAGKGVTTSLENHGFYLQTADRIGKVIDAVKRDNYGLTLDLGNFLCLDQDPVASTRALAKHAVMVHAKDFHVRSKTSLPPSGWFATPTKIGLRGAILGHGVVDLPAQIKLLKKAKYDGWISLEFEGIEEPVMGIKLGLEYLRMLI